MGFNPKLNAILNLMCSQCQETALTIVRVLIPPQDTEDVLPLMGALLLQCQNDRKAAMGRWGGRETLHDAGVPKGEEN